MKRSPRRTGGLALVAAALQLAGCGGEGPQGGGGQSSTTTGSGGGSTTSTTDTTGSGGGSTTSTTGSGGAGGGSTTSTTSTTGSGGGSTGGTGGTGGTGTLCQPGETRECYTGPAGTKDVGACAHGTETCAADGMSWGACQGQVVPVEESCATPVDDDCDGQANEGCPCAPGAVEACYDGPAGTAGVGICKTGTHMCNAQGTGWGPCIGQVTPATESCASPADEDCDGQSDEGCVCFPGAVEACYSGPAGTQGVGVCKAGTRTCDAQGTAWGPCNGEVVPTPESCATPADENCDGTPGCGTHIWSKRFGDAAQQSFEAVTVDATGNTFITGFFSGSVDFGGGALTSAGKADIFLVKLGPNGNHLWSKRFGGTDSDIVDSIALDPAGNIVLGGYYYGTADFGGGPLVSQGQGDALVLKLDANGNHLWSKRFGDGAGQMLSGVAVDAAGNVVVAGAAYGTVDFGGGPLVSAGADDIVLAKLDANGNHLWSKRFGGLNNQHADGVTIDPMGNIIFFGMYAGILDFGGGALSSVGGLDIFLVKLDASGGHVWSKSFGNSGWDDAIRAVAADAAGNLFLGGSFSGTLDFGVGPAIASGIDGFVAKLDASGVNVWTRLFSGSGTQHVTHVSLSGAGDVLVSGYFDGTLQYSNAPSLVSAGLMDNFVAKLDGAAKLLWHKRFGDAASQYHGSMVMETQGGVVLAGGLQGTMDFGGGALTSAGDDDLYVAKLAP